MKLLRLLLCSVIVAAGFTACSTTKSTSSCCESKTVKTCCKKH